MSKQYLFALIKKFLSFQKPFIWPAHQTLVANSFTFPQDKTSEKAEPTTVSQFTTLSLKCICKLTFQFKMSQMNSFFHNLSAAKFLWFAVFVIHFTGNVYLRYQWLYIMTYKTLKKCRHATIICKGYTRNLAMLENQV